MRCSIFIDGNNFYHGLRRLYGKDKGLKKLDFVRFIEFISDKNDIKDIFYYNAELDKHEDYNKFQSQKQFFDELRKVPCLKLVLCKLLKRKIKGTRNYYYVLKEDDIHMAVDMVEGSCKDKFDIALLISGDGDFVPAVNAVQNNGKSVKNIYFKDSSSRNLKNICKDSFELTKDVLDRCFKE